MSRFLFGRGRTSSPWFYISMGALWVALGVSSLIHHDDATGLFALFGAVYVAMGIYRFVDRRRNPDPSEPRVGTIWSANDGRRLTITGIDGDTVRCSRYDPRTGLTDAWVGSRSAFEALVGLGYVAGNQPARA